MAKKGAKQKKPASESTDVDTDSSQPQDLYASLGLEKSASQAEIKKAYHRIALQLHPDKNPGDESAKEKFQTLQHVFSVLGNPEKRRIYDETGCTDDTELAGDKFQDLYQYYRTFFKKVTEEDIEQFEREYRGSEEELKDLKELYARFKGNMDILFEYMLCSEAKVDSHRFKESLEAAIKAGELKPYKAFKQWAAVVAKTPAPADPLKPRTKRSGGASRGGGVDLTAIIQGRQAQREQKQNEFFDALASKYGKQDAKGKKRVSAEPEISEEEFSKIQDRITRKAKKSK